MKNSVSVGELVPLMQEIFKLGKTFVLTAKGASMMPLLHDGRDSITLAACDPNKLKARDVPLYKREDGSYVLHRIIRVNKDSFTMCGDAQTELEHGVLKENVVAKAVGFQRKGKSFSCKSPFYRMYSWAWCAVLPLRPIFFRLNSILRGRKRNEKPNQ